MENIAFSLNAFALAYCNLCETS